jgi:large subunit ribosomal protein L9
MAGNVELLLVETVENLGIVGDVVKVRLGYARNYLLPRQLATVPSEELVKQLQSKRAEAEKHLAEQRAQRQQIIGKLTGFELSLVKSCNDLGVLYGQITQQDIATGLTAAGYPVRPRDVRLSETIKRVGDYEVLVKYETDLETRIKLHVKADRELHKEEKAEMDFDDEGNLITAENPGKVRKGRDRGDRTDRVAAIDAALAADKARRDSGGSFKPAAPAEGGAPAPAAEGKKAAKGEGKSGEDAPKKSSKKAK